MSRAIHLSSAAQTGRASATGRANRRPARTGSALAFLALAAAIGPVAARAQDPGADAPGDVPPLFASDEPIDVTLTAPFALLKGDRSESPDRPGTITVTGPDGEAHEVGADFRTRGVFRLDYCSFPPIKLDVDGSDAVGTVFEGQDELKLVSSCRPPQERYEQLVFLEYLVYRSYQQLTDTSFRVRMVWLHLVDSNGGQEGEDRWGFLIEDDEALAARLGMDRFNLAEGMNLPASGFDPVLLMMTGVFQYMIGNPDWSAVAGHNVEILDRGGVAVSVPYDFDVSGVVDAPYAVPPPDYHLESVRERYYRGWCANPVTTGLVLGRFREAQEAILDVWRTDPRLTEETRRRATSYLQGFFDDIATDERAQRRFLRDCRSVAD